MSFESHAFQLAKDPEHPEENQDAYRIDASAGIAAVADGVASGIFSRAWAKILTDAVAAEPPDVVNRDAFALWLGEQRTRWEQEIDVDSLAWFQKPKLREGAFSTLLWVRAADDEPESDERPDTYRFQCVAVGDSCLFLVRDNRIVRSFPIERSEQLEADPVVIGSVDLGRDELVEFQSIDLTCREGDLVVLCTDAVADWALRACESGSPPDWSPLWEMTEEAWQEHVDSLRTQRQMRYDDATLVLLNVGRQVPRETKEPADEVPAAESAPPPFPADGDWRETLKLLKDQVAEELSGQVTKGVGKLKQMKESAGSAIRKYRDKLRDNE